VETAYEPTNDDLKAMWTRAGLFNSGHTFEDDIQMDFIRKSLRNAAIEYHRKHHHPVQLQLTMEIAV